MSLVIILDAGSQYGKLIDRRVRELNVKTEILPLNTPLSTILETGCNGIIISGGPDSVYNNNSATCDMEIFNQSEIPILGICYGMQLMNKHYNGKISKEQIREDGQTKIKIIANNKLFTSLKEDEDVLLTHGDTIVEVGDEVDVPKKGLVAHPPAN